MSKVAQNPIEVKPSFNLEPNVCLESGQFMAFMMLPKSLSWDDVNAARAALVPAVRAALDMPFRIQVALPVDDDSSGAFIRFDFENADLAALRLMARVAADVVPGTRVSWSRLPGQNTDESLEFAMFPLVLNLNGPDYSTIHHLSRAVTDLASLRGWSVSTVAPEGQFKVIVWDAPGGVSVADVDEFMGQVTSSVFMSRASELGLSVVA
jgi:hypothetical protein